LYSSFIVDQVQVAAVLLRLIFNYDTLGMWTVFALAATGGLNLFCYNSLSGFAKVEYSETGELASAGIDISSGMSQYYLYSVLIL
jgi:hypothetical protein